MNTLDLRPYIEGNGFFRLDSYLRDHGFENKEDVLCVRLDTVAISQLLKISTRTLSRYVKNGLISMDNDNRLSFREALKLKNDYPAIREKARQKTPATPRRQKRIFNRL